LLNSPAAVAESETATEVSATEVTPDSLELQDKSPEPADDDTFRPAFRNSLAMDVQAVQQERQKLQFAIETLGKEVAARRNVAEENAKLVEVRTRQSAEINRLKQMLQANGINSSAMLPTAIPELDFPGETPLAEVLERISTHVTETHGVVAPTGNFRLGFQTDFPELDLEGVTSLEDVTVRDIHLEGITVENALKLIFDQTREPELTYIIQDELLMVTTKAKAESDDSLTLRTYNVRELSALPMPDRIVSEVEFPEGEAGAGIEVKRTEKQTLAGLIVDMTSPPCRWMQTDGEGGAVQLVGDTLVVRQTPAGHRSIVRLLNQLTESSKVDVK
jgi:hypothetical protein